MTKRAESSDHRRTIAVVTGTRAEYGLLQPVIRAIDGHPKLKLQLLVTGTHLITGVESIRDIERDFTITARIPMQDSPRGSRIADALALARGIAGFADWFERQPPDFVVVLGDRIEAFAAASAAAVAGIRVAHVHGGDRAPGVADESLRHAITKLAHIHLPATEQSSLRIIAMGEDRSTVHVVGSPAMDGLDRIAALDDAAFNELGSPAIVVLLHPIGEDDESERRRAAEILELCRSAGRTLVLHPNHDAGRDGIMSAITKAGLPDRAHLPREMFIGLLRRAKLIIGNSSGALIEAAATGIRAINLGDRQAGRESADHVTHILRHDRHAIAHAIDDALKLPRYDGPNPFGDGCTGPRIADLFAALDPVTHPLRKRNTY